MNPTEIRETLLDVAHGTPVPPPDAASFQRRVRRVRARRTATALAAAAGVAVVGLGGFVAADLGASGGPDRARVAAPVIPVTAPTGVPVLIEGKLALVQRDGTIDRTGQRFAHLVGSTPDGVVGFDAAADLVRTDGERVEPITDDAVRVAYLDGDSVVYQTYDGNIRGSDTARLPTRLPGRLMAVGADVLVVGADDGLSVHGADGVTPLVTGSDGSTRTADRVEVAGDTIAVQTGSTVDLFDLDGTRRSGELDSGVGALSPDGTAYAMGPGVRTVDTHTGQVSGDALASEISDIEVVDLAWTERGLYAVTAGDGSRTLWDCGQGARCESVVEDRTATMTLR